MKSSEMTPEKVKATLAIRLHLEKTYGDSVNVKYNRISNGNDSYEVRGHRHCPVCKDKHVRNCVYVNECGGGDFSYKCQAHV